jgi:hypothetical protein
MVFGWIVKNMRKTKTQQHQFRLISFIKVGLTVLISVLMIFTIVKAGTITPPGGAPLAQFYTLSEIYTRLTTNATTTEGSHDFTFSDALIGTGRTLTEIYNAIPTINPSKLLDDTTYLGITGNIATRILSAATTTVNAGYYAATTLPTVDADLATGNIKSGITLFGINGDSNVVDTSPGTLSNNNQIRSSYVCYSDGTQYTGSLADCSSNGQQSCYVTGSYYSGTLQSLTNTTTTVSAGYYAATTLPTVDADLATGNIKSGITLFGINGDSNVVDTSPGTLSNNNQIRSSYVCYSDGTQYTGSLADCSSNGQQSCYVTGSYYSGTLQSLTNTTTTVSAGYYAATTLPTVDADLATGNIKSGITLFGINGDSNVVDTSSGNAVAGDICNSKVAWVDGSQVTGNRTACSSCAAGTATTNWILSGKTADINCDGTAETGVATGVALNYGGGPTLTCDTGCATIGLTCISAMFNNCTAPTGTTTCSQVGYNRCCICH